MNGAVRAPRLLLSLVSTHRDGFLRPAAQLGVFTAFYIASVGFIPVFAALQGVQAQMRLHRTTDVTDNDTFALLQEFGSILSVSVPDILNRSDDRIQTLNDYVQGLQNITQRAQQRATELDARISDLEGTRRTAQSKVNTIQRTVNQALRDKDYATAAAEQQALGEAQGELSKIQVDLKLTQDVARTYEQLLDIANRRLTAIDQNREILIAGLQVVNLPGIEDLNILRQGEGSRNRSDSIFSL